MYTQSLILAVLPLMAHAVDIIQFAIWEDSVPNTECNLDLDGAYCRGLNNTQVDGRDPDSFAVFNGEDGDPCAVTTEGYCGGGGGFEDFCWATGGGQEGCGAKETGGSLWHSGDERLEGRFAKRSVDAVKPNVAGIWDAVERKHRHFKMGGDVPSDVTTILVEAVKANAGYGYLDESVKAFEIAE
ncbi:uncharacterized protein J4E92_009449 [Alternaria infectoria]|uniref:uncharacterized protein n=1 Tax=Alternaria viburni TaxID=566460 RepID=UPI0020C4D3A2|nr:uncharacterized protein J4E79_004504 [Alternaria viburni]XP_051348948.1 uncharacterized protein J4E92_009449 [Alternaria infectoria]KAI4662217.1 hypothetical protein J4E79_004504 [Alternaria viburni]KAI4915173.1 hypothetical protein J4E92_009449 [Alternaria infectoria]